MPGGGTTMAAVGRTSPTPTYRSGSPCDLLTAPAMLRHLWAAPGRLLSSACLARAIAMASATSPCSVMRLRAARATSWSVAMSDYGAHGDRFADKNPIASPPQASTAPFHLAAVARPHLTTPPSTTPQTRDRKNHTTM